MDNGNNKNVNIRIIAENLIEETQIKIREIKIYDFMLSEFKLKGLELILYAIIYSYTDEKKECYYSYEEILTIIRCKNRKQLSQAIKNLCDKKLIYKRTVIRNSHAKSIYGAKKTAFEGKKLNKKYYSFFPLLYGLLKDKENIRLNYFLMFSYLSSHANNNSESTTIPFSEKTIMHKTNIATAITIRRGFKFLAEHDLMYFEEIEKGKYRATLSNKALTYMDSAWNVSNQFQKEKGQQYREKLFRPIIKKNTQRIKRIPILIDLDKKSDLIEEIDVSLTANTIKSNTNPERERLYQFAVSKYGNEQAKQMLDNIKPGEEEELLKLLQSK